MLTPNPPSAAAARRRAARECGSASATRAAASPRCTTRPASMTTTVSAMRRTSGQVLLDEQDRGGRGHLGQNVGDLGDELRRQALGRLVDEQQHVVAAADTRARATICCCPPDSVPARWSRRATRSGNSCATTGAPDAASRPDEPEVLVHRQPTEHLAVLGHVADAATNQCERLAASGSHCPCNAIRPCRGASPRIALRVVVLPTPLRPSSAVTPRAREPRRRRPGGCATRRSGRGGPRR